MATAQLSSDDLVRALERLGTREVEKVISRLLALRAERRAPNLPPRESELMLKINEGLPADKSARYRDLMTRRRAGALTPEEHRDLLSLTDEAERLQAERVQSLTELARLRGTSLRALMEKLDLKPS
jgi:hypothetical protein